MTPDRSPNDRSVGYDTDVDPGAMDGGSHFGSDDVEIDRSVGELANGLATAESVSELLETVERHGWTPPLLGLSVHGVSRGVFEHLSDPFVLVEGYWFPGWQLALGINLFYGLFLVLFAWFLYFGLISAIAGYLSTVRVMDTTVFKVGGYLSALYAPIFVVGSALVLTIPAPDVAVTAEGIDSMETLTAMYGQVYDTPQMRLVRILKGIGWIVVGFLVLPVVEERFDLDKRESVIAVLPVTLVAVVWTQLL